MTPHRALLFTDVVDSTRLSHALGDAEMGRLWAAHDRAARDLLQAWRGREIEKTDGLLALFDTADDAVGFALGYHRALAALHVPLTARAAIHIGAVALRETSEADAGRGAKRVEVDGLVKPVAARVMSVALGGQTLLSVEARAALRAPSQRLLSHGHWHLKGLPEPVELFEIGEAGAPFAPPPDQEKAWRVVRQRELWVPAREVRHSLPAERDSFVGRVADQQLLARKLESGARLVSVLGMGGTGKTRLVTRFAWSQLGAYPGGVWFCDLAQARSVDGIHFAVAQGLDVPLGKGEPVVQLGYAIAGRGRCLVILDNFEQVARHAEASVGHWLERAPEACFLVTTREVLGIVGEETLALAPLPMEDAAALFVRRAESVQQGYRPDPGDGLAIAQLVKSLDGLPLAIELAAARVRLMPPSVLLARMHERFDLLLARAGRRDRQSTLRAAFDWSWELLSDPEREGLAQLSVFRGGFDLAAAEAVIDVAAGPHRPWTVDLLQWLVEKSFVRQLDSGRFDLLESVREYAAEHLRTPGRYPGSGSDARDAAERRHGRFFAALGPRRAIEHACVELDNLVVACRRATQRGDAAMAAEALNGAWSVLRLRGPFRLGIELAEAVRSIDRLDGRARIQTELVSGWASQFCGMAAQARRHLEAALAGARQLGDRELEGRALHPLAALTAQAGQIDAAAAAYREALVAVRDSGDRSLECAVRNGLGSFNEAIGRIDEAKLHYEAALACSREAGDRRWEGGTAGNLAGWYASQGRAPEARALYAESIAIAIELGDRPWEANARCNLGLLHFGEGLFHEAKRELEASLQAARELGHARLLSIVQCNLGLLAEALGDPVAALADHQAALALARELGDRRSEGQFLGYLGVLHARQGRALDASDSLAAGEALLRAVSDRLSLGILLCGRAEAWHRAGDPGAASAALAEARRIATELDEVPADSEFGRALGAVGELSGASA